MGILELVMVLATIAGLFIWNRAESRADIRHMEIQINSIRELVHAIQIESKDFHGRLCKIEAERNK